MKLLFKQAIKSVFANKIFTSIMLIIIFISGATYTLFQSTANSFESSYNKLVNDGNLHDAIIKQKYEVSGSYSLESNNEQKGTEYSADIVYKVPDPAATNNDYLNYLKQQFPNNFITKVTTTGGGTDDKLKKLVESEISRQTSIINKNVVGTKSIDFAKAITTIYKDDLTTDNTQSLTVENSSTAFKAVTSNTIDPANDFIDGIKKNGDDNIPYDDNAHNVNKLVMYDGTNQFTQNQKYSQMEDMLKYRAAIQNIPITPTTIINRSKGYRWSVQNNLAQTAIYTDPSAYEAVVSPSYANNNNKLSIAPNEFLQLYTKYMGQFPWIDSPDHFMDVFTMDTTNQPANVKELQDKLKAEYAQNLMWVDKTPYFIIGIGTTPDFAYPIIDQAHPTPDVNSQAIVFMNRRGYERIYDAFRTAPNENYISLKFKSNISAVRQDEIRAQISDIARRGNAALSKYNISYGSIIPVMAWPNNIDIVTKYNDNHDSILLAEERVQFLGKLKQTLNTLSYMTTIMLLIFVSSIVVLVFSSLLSAKRKILATLLSLGYTKNKIALSFATVSLLIGAVPSLLGYMIGHFMQYAFIDIFSNYWTIPIYGEVFSWLSLVIIVALPFIALFLLIFLITLWQLRHNVINMLHDNVVKYNFAPSILKYFKFFSVKSKYSISLIINNFWRLILISITGIISVSAIIVGLSTLGRATYAYNATSNISNYTYKVDLYSPTSEGGTYNDVDYDKLHDLLTDPNTQLPIGPTYKQVPTSTPDPILNNKLNNPNWHIPGLGDASLANIDTMPNPIPSYLLPYVDHYLRYKFQTKPLLNFSIGGSKNLNPWEIAKKLMPDNQKNIADENAAAFMFNPQKPIPSPTTGSSDLNSNYVKYFQDQMTYNQNTPLYPYTISYQNVITNDTDEEYTYIKTNYQKDNKIENFNITGYSPTTKYLNIPKNLTEKLESHASDSTTPILINKYIEAYLNIGVGDTLTMDVNNNVDRFNTSGSTIKTHKKEFKIQGILNTYNDSGMYTLQSIANKVIGLDTINKGPSGLPNQLFNGVFTKDKNPALLNSLPLYSPSGVYLATDIISGSWKSILDQIISTGPTGLWQNTYVTNSDEFISKYGSTPLVGSFESINWKNIDQYTFKNISTLASYLIIIIQLISILLSILFAIIVSSLFIDSNKKKIATLWALGYRKREIIKIFLNTYSLPIILTIIFSLPISFAIVSIMRLTVMGFAHILIPFAITWWMPFVGVVIIGLIFVFSIIATISLMKENTALAAFSEE